MLNFAIRNLLSRPVRSLLALLGLTVAIAGMVGLFSVAEGIDQMVASTFGRIPGLLVMQRGAPIPLFSNLPADWEDDLRQVEGVAVVSPEIWTRVNLIENERIVSPPRFLFGTDIPSRQKLTQAIYQSDMVAGRFLIPEDRGTNNTVISRQIAEDFGKDVGDTLRVNGTDLKIVGLYHCGSLFLDVAIIVDIDQLRAMTRFDPATVNCFYIEPAKNADPSAVIERIENTLRGRPIDTWQPSGLLAAASDPSKNPVAGFFTYLDRGVKSGEWPSVSSDHSVRTAASSPSAAGTILVADTEDVPVEVRTADDWAERIDEFSADLDVFLLIMTTIGVTIAVLSIINTMLMSVTERIIEFGILKANGWSKGDIMRLITFESAFLGLLGGVLGCLLGWIGTHIVNWQWSEHVYLFASPGLLLFSLGFSTALGILGGLYPAIWATRMMPMEAIRRG